MHRPGPRNHGISLLEVLLVAFIVAALTATALALLRQRAHARRRQVTEERIEALEALIRKLGSASPGGSVPTSDPEDFRGVDGGAVSGLSDAEDPENHGIECLVLALRQGSLEIAEEMLADVDHDAGFPEVVDGWGNPYVYIDHTSYEEDARGVKVHMADGRVLTVRPLREPGGGFRHPDRYQLISAGADGEFGTRDDLTN